MRVKLGKRDLGSSQISPAIPTGEKIGISPSGCILSKVFAIATLSKDSHLPHSLRFVDLFAGLGGFHQALTRLGHRCVFASEIDPELSELYERNFGLKPVGDIRKAFMSVPAHDILCAGFPCQPFSKAGDQMGFDCPQWGDLFDYVIKILDQCKPKYILIENVPNLMRHADGKTWKKICRRLRKHGYVQSGKTLSFTTVIGLARDNGFPLVILVAGNKDSLLTQSHQRLHRDLNVDGGDGLPAWIMERNPKVQPQDSRDKLA
jgi:hypothetical protein